jgi:hypothetical protein
MAAKKGQSFPCPPKKSWSEISSQKNILEEIFGRPPQSFTILLDFNGIVRHDDLVFGTCLA